MKANPTLCRSAGILILGTMLALVSGCAVSQSEEIEMGLDAAPSFEKEYGGLHPDQQLQQYVNRVGQQLARYTGRGDLPWSFRVLDSDAINAFALPGGQVYITSGLLFRLSNEAQMAAILAHEAGHVAHRHSVNQLERAQVIQGGAALAGVVGGGGAVGDISQIVGSLVMMRYSREQEREADLTGLDYLVRAGYDPRALTQSLEIIENASNGQRPPDFLSTHPTTENRVESLQEYIDQQYPGIISGGRVDVSEFQRNVLRQRR